MRLIVSGGGTGGHVYPALAAVHALKHLLTNTAEPLSNNDSPTKENLDILWIGSRHGMEQGLVERAHLKFTGISALGLRGKNPLTMLKGLWALGQGYRQSRQILKQFKPEVLFVTGGYVCVPVTLAAWRLGIPILIYLPDIEPGFAIKFLAQFATRVAVTASEAQQFFKPGLTVVTGYPTRSDVLTNSDQAEPSLTARQQLGLDPDLPVLLLFGGSRGARSLNQALTQDLETYLSVAQVLHITGKLDEAWVQEKRDALPEAAQKRYHVSAYLHETMPAALRAADLVISRAGASVLGEFPAAGLAAILVPYPYAGAHQTLNANYLVKHHAARLIKDEALQTDLKDSVINLLTNKQALHTMRQASRALAQPDAATQLAQQVLEMRHYGN
ncbi:MAG: UDP-N-acetylglucosamine--N-acetylmuramyl-(pentapeptide) pyrophosphoryl-undecaprenol N-acetylglucosamine transferase [Chloroflexota bacterium]